MAQITREELQHLLTKVESTYEYPNLNALFQACAETPFAKKRGLKASTIYSRVNTAIKEGNPLTIKTRPGRIRKGGMSDVLRATQPVASVPATIERDTPPPVAARQVSTSSDLEAVKPRTGESELDALRREIAGLRRRYAVYIGEDESLRLNPECVRRTPANGYPTNNDAVREADASWEKFIDGLRAAKEMLAIYHQLGTEVSLNSFDTTRIKEAEAALSAFHKSTRVASLSDLHKTVGQGKKG